MSIKALLKKRRITPYSVGVLVTSLLTGTGILSVTGHCSSPKIEIPNPVLSQTVTNPALALSEAFIAIANHVKPAVVTVYSDLSIVNQKQGFESRLDNELLQRAFGPNSNCPPKTREGKRNSLGSGMIIDKLGNIITNYHVIQDMDVVKVKLPDKRIFKAEVIGIDHKTDVAIIRVKDVSCKEWPCVQMGNSDLMHVGEVVMAIGTPFGLEQTVTTGIISAINRPDWDIVDYSHLSFLQTNTSMNKGSSGGPLINMRGEVIGMNAAGFKPKGYGSTGINFAIPSNIIKNILPTLIQGGRIARGVLGIEVQELTKELAKQLDLSKIHGVLVCSVDPYSTADIMGIQIGDVVLYCNNKEINSYKDLRNIIQSITPGTDLKVELIRRGQKITLSCPLREEDGEIERFGSKSTKESCDITNIGMTIQTLTPKLALLYGLNKKKGIVIIDIEEDGLANKAGLRLGDVILGINNEAVMQVSEVRTILVGRKKLVLIIKYKHP
jgi:serine protease Do